MDAVAGGSGIWEEVEARLVLDGLPGVGIRGVIRLLDHFGSARRALAAPSGTFDGVVRRRAALHRADPTLVDAAAQAVVVARRLGMAVVLYGREGYPRRLHHLADPPPVLFLRGDTELAASGGVAIVGPRRCTRRGRDVARALGAALGRRGVPVLSGMALGVDGSAHEGALDASGPTVAVMGRGADQPYPLRHARLFRRIVDSGLVVSEFGPGAPPLPHHFPRRNRVLAALSDTVVVVEAAARSGALITAEHGLDLGLDIWAVPGPIDAPTCRGSNALLSDGARALVSVDDFVREVVGGEATAAEDLRLPPGPEGRLLALVSREGVDAAEVAREADVPLTDALALLASLEVRGWVEQLPGLRFRRAG